MKKIILFILVCVLFSSCLVTRRPRPIGYRYHWWNSWHGHNYYHPHRHH